MSSFTSSFFHPSPSLWSVCIYIGKRTSPSFILRISYCSISPSLSIRQNITEHSSPLRLALGFIDQRDGGWRRTSMSTTEQRGRKKHFISFSTTMTLSLLSWRPPPPHLWLLCRKCVSYGGANLAPAPRLGPNSLSESSVRSAGRRSSSWSPHRSLLPCCVWLVCQALVAKCQEGRRMRCRLVISPRVFANKH